MRVARRSFLAAAAAAAAMPRSFAAQAAPPIPIIDTHIHLFDPTRPQGAPYSGPRPAPGQTPIPAYPDRYRRLAVPLGVVGAIKVEASPWIEDNLWILEVAERDPIMVGVVGNLEPDKPEFAEYLDRYHKNPLFRAEVLLAKLDRRLQVGEARPVAARLDFHAADRRKPAADVVGRVDVAVPHRHAVRERTAFRQLNRIGDVAGHHVARRTHSRRLMAVMRLLRPQLLLRPQSDTVERTMLDSSRIEEGAMPHTCRTRWAVGAIAVVTLAFQYSLIEIGHAQQSGVPAEAPGFIGKTATLDTTGYSVGRRIFAPGSHNATWHMHAAGQLIYAESGHGRYQIKGQPIRELGPGDTGYIPGGTMHWHGSVPNESFTMTFVTMGAGATTPGEPITDDIYLGKK